MKILIVDDEPDFFKLMTERFRKELKEGKFEFIPAYDGLQALEVMKQNSDISIVLTDINMPKMDGLKLLSSIERNNKILLTLVISAYGDITNIRAAMNQGAFDFITKPVDFNDLRKTIDKTLNHFTYLKELKTTNSELSLLSKALQDSLNFRNEMLGIAVHDLKNPLQSIIGFSELLDEKINGEKFKGIELIKEELVSSKAFINTIMKSSTYMLDIITGLLKSVELESDNLKLDFQIIDFSEVILFTVDQNRLKAEKKGQLLKVEVDYGLMVQGDFAKLIEVVDNLISNAIKYTHSGKEIIVKCKRELLQDITTEKINSQIVLSVKDEGQGLSVEDLSNLFIKFKRLSSKPTGNESSTGLGLSIVKQIIELHNGKVWAESEGKGKGTTFFLTIPSI